MLFVVAVTIGMVALFVKAEWIGARIVRAPEIVVTAISATESGFGSIIMIQGAPRVRWSA
jgi:hypothetical protein